MSKLMKYNTKSKRLKIKQGVIEHLQRQGYTPLQAGLTTGLWLANGLHRLPEPTKDNVRIAVAVTHYESKKRTK